MALFILLSQTTGCASLLEGREPPQYRYLMASSADMTRPRSEAISTQRPGLHVQVTTVGMGLDSDQIMARSGARLTPIRKMRWTEDTDTLFEKTLVHHLEPGPPFGFVTRQRGGAAAPISLTADLHAFYVVLEDERPTQAEVAVTFRLHHKLQRQPAAVWQMAEQEPITGAEEAAVAMAMQRAMARVLENLRLALGNTDLSEPRPSRGLQSRHSD